MAADIADRTEAQAAVAQTVAQFGRLDILVNNAGLMLLGPVVGADPDEWDRMIAVNNQGLLYTTNAALPHLLRAAEDGPRRVADIVNISSVAGRVAGSGYGVYNLTKFGVNGFTEALRQEITKRHVRVGVLEPGAVTTELGSHNSDQVQAEMISPFFTGVEVIGALNAYSSKPAAFATPEALDATLIVAETVAVVMVNAQAHGRLAEEAANLRLAMESRAVIEQAKGVIMRSGT